MLNLHQRLWLLGAFIVATTFLTGCGPRFVPVSGTVTYKKQPLKQGTIVFHPEKGRAATGKIVDGNIVEVTTFSAGDGATLGPNKVAVFAPEDPDDMYNEKSLIPRKYNNPDESNLRCDLKSDKNEVKFDLD